MRRIAILPLLLRTVGWVPGFYLGKRRCKRNPTMIVRERHLDFDMFLFIGT